MAGLTKDSKIAVSTGATWDVVAYDAYADCFMCDAIRRAPDNARKYADVLSFDGGETVTLPADALKPVALVNPAPWEV